jgi:hypothetical protein
MLLTNRWGKLALPKASHIGAELAIRSRTQRIVLTPLPDLQPAGGHGDMVLLYIRNSQHVPLFHPKSCFLNFFDQVVKFFFGAVQKKPKPKRGDLEIIEMVECA